MRQERRHHIVSHTAHSFTTSTTQELIGTPRRDKHPSIACNFLFRFPGTAQLHSCGEHIYLHCADLLCPALRKANCTKNQNFEIFLKFNSRRTRTCTAFLSTRDRPCQGVAWIQACRNCAGQGVPPQKGREYTEERYH